MSNRVTVRHRRELIMLLYSLWSMVSPFSYVSSAIAMLIGVDMCFISTILNFFIKSFVYLA
jgi:hypothetical protein